MMSSFYGLTIPILVAFYLVRNACPISTENNHTKIRHGASKHQFLIEGTYSDLEAIPKMSENLEESVPNGSNSDKYVEKKPMEIKEEFEEEYYSSELPHEVGNNHSTSSGHHGSTIHVASWQFDYVRTPLVYTTVVIVAGFCKIGFHHAGFLSSIFPESCVLIMLGIVVGTIVHFTHSREMLPQFTPKAFFLFLLPPIVLESAYSLHDRAFFSNLGTILLYAVVGTLINCFAIGISLYGLTESGVLTNIKLDLIECLVFSSLISAVDPVAVLAIFQEVGVNKNLYFLVFGESLLNDAVTIVLYMMMVTFSKSEFITAEQIAMGIAAFLCVSIGGLAIGIVMGIITALITKHTEEVRVVEPLAMLGMAYLSYLLAEMIHFSGIISIIGCGIMQAHYASKNISQKSNTTVKYFTKMISAVSDTVIFLFLGMVLVDDAHVWHTGFVLWSAGFCFIYRFMGVFVLTYCANKLERTKRINTEEQFIMAYGGLRGAVAFSLVIMLDDIEHKNLFITATLFIVLFTVFIQGATIKPLVVLLKIRRHTTKTSSMFTEVNKKLVDHVMAGVEEVTGDHGGHHWKQLLFKYNRKYLKKWLMCNYTDSNLSRVYTQMMLEDHYAHLYGPAAVIEDKKPLLLHRISVDGDDEMLEGFSTLDDNEEEHGEDHGHKDFRKMDLHMDDNGHEFRPHKSKIQAAKRLQMPLRERQRSPSVVSTAGLPTMKRQTTVFRRHEEDNDPSRLLHKALHDNRYNKLHHKYNPNLVGDDDQEMDIHLRLRRMRAKRLTLLAMHPSPRPVVAVTTATTTTTISTPATTTQTVTAPSERRVSIDVNSPAVINAASFFLERAAQKRNLMKIKKQKQDLQKDASSSDTKAVKLENQGMVANAPKATSSLNQHGQLQAVIVEAQPQANTRGQKKDSVETKV